MRDLRGLQELQTLNRLLAELAGGDPHVASQLDAVLQFMGRRRELPEAQDGQQTAQTLLAFHAELPSMCGLRVLDFSDGLVEPLFFRARVLEALEGLQGHARVVIVFRGLRRALCPEGCRWSRRREALHQDLLDQAGELVLRENFCGAPVHLVFL
ncbi:MAG: hypothetical protein ACFB20_03665 [Opitutales bacterium]